jgi:hypothetical protein
LDWMISIGDRPNWVTLVLSSSSTTTTSSPELSSTQLRQLPNTRLALCKSFFLRLSPRDLYHTLRIRSLSILLALGTPYAFCKKGEAFVRSVFVRDRSRMEELRASESGNIEATLLNVSCCDLPRSQSSLNKNNVEGVPVANASSDTPSTSSNTLDILQLPCHPAHRWLNLTVLFPKASPLRPLAAILMAQAQCFSGERAKPHYRSIMITAPFSVTQHKGPILAIIELTSSNAVHQCICSLRLVRIYG